MSSGPRLGPGQGGRTEWAVSARGWSRSLGKTASFRSREPGPVKKPDSGHVFKNDFRVRAPLTLAPTAAEVAQPGHADQLAAAARLSRFWTVLCLNLPQKNPSPKNPFSCLTDSANHVDDGPLKSLRVHTPPSRGLKG